MSLTRSLSWSSIGLPSKNLALSIILFKSESVISLLVEEGEGLLVRPKSV